MDPRCCLNRLPLSSLQSINLSFLCGADGLWVQPEQVVGPDQPGRKICMLGVTDNLLSALPWVQAADAIVLGADTQVLRTTLAQTITW